jgi:hypothetical protein
VSAPPDTGMPGLDDAELRVLLALADDRKLRRAERAIAAAMLETPEGRRLVERQRLVAHALRSGGPVASAALQSRARRSAAKPAARERPLDLGLATPVPSMSLHAGSGDERADEQPGHDRR